MREQRSYKDSNQKKKKWNTRGFYITLGVSLVAVGMAAWTTYASITNSLRQTDKPSSQSPVGQTVSGVTASEPESQTVVSSMVPSSTPESTVSRNTVSSEVPSRITSGSKPVVSSGAEPSTQTVTVPEPKVFTYPLQKEITKAYSGDNLVYSETMQDWRVHQGMDLRAKVGDVVKTVAQGTVKDIYEDALLGNVIVISHGTLEVRYCGLGDTALVKKGATVKAGQEIGSVGTVPFELAEEPHLHLEIRRDGTLQDPETVLTESAQKAS